MDNDDDLTYVWIEISWLSNNYYIFIFFMTKIKKNYLVWCRTYNEYRIFEYFFCVENSEFLQFLNFVQIFLRKFCTNTQIRSEIQNVFRLISKTNIDSSKLHTEMIHFLYLFDSKTSNVIFRKLFGEMNVLAKKVFLKDSPYVILFIRRLTH